MVILGLGNPLYSRDLTIQPPHVRQAYENYAVAAVKHFQNQGILWELVNEPNHPFFWKPKPDVEEYIAMVKSLLPKLKMADPSGTWIAPSTAGVPLDFLKACFTRGADNTSVLDQVDAISVHPYQAFPTNKTPETFLAEYQQVKTLVEHHAPERNVPILLGEWGYSTAIGEVSETQQADYAVRQALLGFMVGTPVNIWYNWEGDIQGYSSKADKEHQFGLMTGCRLPKPAYWALRDLYLKLNGQAFIERIKTANESDFILRFAQGTKQTLVGWTVGMPHTVQANGETMRLGSTPVYSASNALPQALGARGASAKTFTL